MEFQAVVLAAGRGSRMTELTSSQLPKALLPIGNLPMMWYPINMLERAGFEEAIVIVLDIHYNEIKRTLDLCDVNMRLDYVSIKEADYMGTADSLRHIRGKVKRDLLVVSCDLITDVSLHHIANVFRTYDATVTMFLSSTQDSQADVPTPGPKTKKRSEKDFIGFDEKGLRVLFMTSEADLEDDTISFRKSLLRKHPNINIKSNLTDCHLYLMKKWVVDYLADHTELSSIKGELIPHLVRKQFSKPKKKTELPNPNDSVVADDNKSDIFSYVPDTTLTSDLCEMSTWIDHTGDMEDCYHGDKIRCYSYIVSGGLCVRTNTVTKYCETNRQIPKVLMATQTHKEVANVHPTATLKGKSQVGSDCLVGECTTIGEKVSIKRSIIAKHCSIGDKVKVTNSVILGHVNIEEGCNIQGSVVCPNAHISERCELKDCIVGEGQTVPSNSKLTNESVVAENEMMEI